MFDVAILWMALKSSQTSTCIQKLGIFKVGINSNLIKSTKTRRGVVYGNKSH